MSKYLGLATGLIWLVGYVGCVGGFSFESDQQLREAAKLLAHDAATSLGRDIHYGLQETTSLRSMRNHYRPQRNSPGSFSISSVEWPELHGQIARDMGYAMRWAKETVESIVEEAENLASNHSFKKDLMQDYNDVYYIVNSEPDEKPNPANGMANELDYSSMLDLNAINNGSLYTDTILETLPTPDSLQSSSQETSITPSPVSISDRQQPATRILKLSPHQNFDDTLVNTEESAVHVPVHLFYGEPQIMNGIVWSEALTKTFRNNFVQNPTLTNQYFASQDGFLRLFPARKWPIPQNQPDLYDARMRPWYLAGASSRKDVVILVDSSGSMTGSRRDIAKGVVFEILDTLTDNDNFLILKFSDSVQQVGVPSCPGMRVERVNSSIPLKNTLFTGNFINTARRTDNNDTVTLDYGSFYLTQASGKNIRHVKSNFSIPTAGIANFSRALVTAFEVLANYQQSMWSGVVQCNQAIMLITDGAPSDFMDIFARYNIPNAPVRVFTYLIGRDAGDVTNTKMMACHNRGFYTHVINLAEVRETVQQYIPVMARPLVLNGTHPVLWTPAYGDLTYQILTDWVWESRRRDKARAIVRAQRGSGGGGGGGISNVIISDEESSPSAYNGPDDVKIDLFGYNSNPSCFWEINRNDLLTTVVQPVYDKRKETNVTEKFLYKNVWTIRETLKRTAKILGVAAADMRINNLMSYAPSHKLGVNAYPILLTNNGFVMHHPDLRSILEPQDSSDKNMRILKPFFSSMDFTEVEHVLDGQSQEATLLTLRREAILGMTGFRKLATKRMFDCNKRVQTRDQNFYYKPIDQFPFSFTIATPEPYGSRRIDATIDIKTTKLSENFTTYFKAGGSDGSNLEFISVHPGYKYCVGPSNSTLATLLDMISRIDSGAKNDIQWKPAESTKPPIFLPGKIVCDKNLVESLVFDAVATFNFSLGSPQPSTSAESSLLGMFGIRFAFVSTRSGLLRVRYFDHDDDRLRQEALTFSGIHNRGVDETFYSRTADYNMLNNRNATIIQVPFNTNERIRQKLTDYKQTLAFDNINTYESATGEGSSVKFLADLETISLEEKLRDVLTNVSLHVIATQSILGEEGPREAVAGVTGVFYDFGTFVLRFFKLTNERLSQIKEPKSAACFSDSEKSCNDSTKLITCGSLDDDIDCLLVDNNGYIVVSEDLNYIGRSLKSYEPSIMQLLVETGVFHEVSVTDYQAICEKQEEKQPVTSSAISSMLNRLSVSSVLKNLVSSLTYATTLLGQLAFATTLPQYQNQLRISRDLVPISSLLPNKTYLRPCLRTHTLYETRPGHPEKGDMDYLISTSNCSSWFTFEQVPDTNLIILVVKLHKDKESCLLNSWSGEVRDDANANTVEIIEQDEASVCAKLEKEWKLDKRRIDTCFSHHPDEDNIKLCDSANSLTIPDGVITLIALLSILFSLS